MLAKSVDTYNCDFCDEEIEVEHEPSHWGGQGQNYPNQWSRISLSIPSERIVPDETTQALIDSIAGLAGKNQSGLVNDMVDVQMNHMTRLLPPFQCQLDCCPECMDAGPDIWPIVRQKHKEAVERQAAGPPGMGMAVPFPHGAISQLSPAPAPVESEVSE